ncbi:ORC-CDC6 family AAA ATPase [Azospirillum argentinense]
MLDNELLAWAKGIAGIELGDLIIDHFIDNGKIGCVYVGHSKHLPSRPLAIKLIFSPSEGWEVELNKVQLLDQVPGVVRFRNVSRHLISHNGREENALVTVWQYIPGRNLKNHLKAERTCTVSFLCGVVKTILNVLHHCEGVNEIKRHGDLHSKNILISETATVNLDHPNQKYDVFVSDFGYGQTGGVKAPKNDYLGLAQITREIISYIDLAQTNDSERRLLLGLRDILLKHLKERDLGERVPPGEIYRQIVEIEMNATRPAPAYTELRQFSVGQLQSSEMFGENWEKWKRLFVPSVPARSQIFAPGMATVITGPRGCGKTMLFRRLSQRLMLECGPIDGLPNIDFVGFYVNANDVADAFPSFPKEPSEKDAKRLTGYLNLCILSDFLAVQAAISAQGKPASPQLLAAVAQDLFGKVESRFTVRGENELDHLRARLESCKWSFLLKSSELPISETMTSHLWFDNFLKRVARPNSDWLGQTRPVYLLIDDYTIPRIKPAMQAVLNRILFRRSDQYIAKIATEAATTFEPMDSTQKVFQIGEDFTLIDLAAESLELPPEERSGFLGEVLARRLQLDERIPNDGKSLQSLLGDSVPSSFSEFARQLRKQGADPLYSGHQMFVGLWSGDTRTMLQLMQALVDAGMDSKAGNRVHVPIPAKMQNDVLVAKGGQWLQDLTHYEPSNSGILRSDYVQEAIKAEKSYTGFKGYVSNSYGAHLKAVVEAFSAKARKQLLGDTYLDEGRELAYSAFRIEITDQFRVEGLAAEVYKDLIRYGVFLRDGRGKSVRGALVPRLFLRRFLLPYCKLVPTTKDSVKMTCPVFCQMLLSPDAYREVLGEVRRMKAIASGQEDLFSNDGGQTDG